MLQNPQEWVALKQDMPDEYQKICDSAYTVHSYIFNPNHHQPEGEGAYRIVFIRRELQVLRTLLVSLLRKTEEMGFMPEEQFDLGETTDKKEKKNIVSKLEEDVSSHEYNLKQLEENTLQTPPSYAIYLKEIYLFLSMVHTLLTDTKKTFHQKISHTNEIPRSKEQLWTEIHGILQLIIQYTTTVKVQRRGDKTKTATELFYLFRNGFNAHGQAELMVYIKQDAPGLSAFILDPPKLPEPKITSYTTKLVINQINIELDLREDAIKRRIQHFQTLRPNTDTGLNNMTRIVFGYNDDDYKVFIASVTEASIRYVGLMIPYDKAKKLRKALQEIKLPSGKKAETKEMEEEDIEAFLKGDKPKKKKEEGDDE